MFTATTRSFGDNAYVLALSGELDLDSAGRAEQQLRWLERLHPNTIVIDLRNVTFMDSTGLRLVASSHARGREAGRKVLIVPGSDPVQRVFKITALDRRLDFVDAETMGLDSQNATNTASQ